MYQAALQVAVSFVLLSHLLAKDRLPRKAASSSESDFRVFSAFQANYLFVYLLAVAADWVQGPYVYALYAQYGFAKTDIGRLYIAGFASSAVFGTVIAAVADKYGRILGGIAYSILSSAFESWMVYEHVARSFHPSLLATTFARAQFWNGVVAIAAGQISGWFAHRYGKVMPFDVAILVLLVLFAVVAITWNENYGDEAQSVRGGFARAWQSLLSDEKIMLLGISQSAFEGALYTFTFMWTPALQTAVGQVGEIPHGTVFSSFMAATMIGSNIFAYASRCMPVESLMRNVFIVGAILFTASAISQRIELVYSSFLLFEILCGIYFPGMATMRAPYIPEESRSCLLTFFRVPLNLIVVFALYEDMSVSKVFSVCAGLMVVAVASQQRLINLTRLESCKDETSDEELYKMEKAAET